MGSIVPISLLANIILIKKVLSVMLFTKLSKLIKPFLSTSIYVTLKPNFSKVLQLFKIAGCSIFDVIKWSFPVFLNFCKNAIPFKAILSLSEPQLVNVISLALQFINLATLFLAISIAFLDLLPNP